MGRGVLWMALIAGAGTVVVTLAIVARHFPELHSSDEVFAALLADVVLFCLAASLLWASFWRGVRRQARVGSGMTDYWGFLEGFEYLVLLAPLVISVVCITAIVSLL